MIKRPASNKRPASEISAGSADEISAGSADPIPSADAAMDPDQQQGADQQQPEEGPQFDEWEDYQEWLEEEVIVPDVRNTLQQFRDATEASIKESLTKQGKTSERNFKLSMSCHCVNLGDPAESGDLIGCWGENAVTMQHFPKNPLARKKIIEHLQRLKRSAFQFTTEKNHPTYESNCSQKRVQTT